MLRTGSVFDKPAWRKLKCRVIAVTWPAMEIFDDWAQEAVQTFLVYNLRRRQTDLQGTYRINLLEGPYRERGSADRRTFEWTACCEFHCDVTSVWPYCGVAMPDRSGVPHIIIIPVTYSTPWKRKELQAIAGRHQAKKPHGDSVVGIRCAVRSEPQLVDSNEAWRYSDTVNNATDTLTDCQYKRYHYPVVTKHSLCCAGKNFIAHALLSFTPTLMYSYMKTCRTIYIKHYSTRSGLTEYNSGVRLSLPT
jgi:hypothetical protein